MLKYLFAIFFLIILPEVALTEENGAYLAKIGDCTSCHTAAGGKPFAGGYKVNSPLGPIYGTNITPDKEYGIGDYSLSDFTRAIRQGIAKDGHNLYPAMPYPNFAKMSDEDVAALYKYFMHTVSPVHEKAHETHLIFPFNQRWGIPLWNIFFAPDKRYQANSRQDAKWNRGAYLVQSIGHCGSCHTPRGLAYEELGTSESERDFLTGYTLDNWYAANLRASKASGLERWSEKDIADFLATGHAAGAIAFGDMQMVVENSSQYMTEPDRMAIAYYLKSLPPHNEEASYYPGTAPTQTERPGAGFYASSCASCHKIDGLGKLPFYPALAGNPVVMSEYPVSVIRIIIEGGKSPQTVNGLKPLRMPGFDHHFTPQEIADIVNYIRESWGNHAASVTAHDVKKLEDMLQKPAATTPAVSLSKSQ